MRRRKFIRMGAVFFMALALLLPVAPAAAASNQPVVSTDNSTPTWAGSMTSDIRFTGTGGFVDETMIQLKMPSGIQSQNAPNELSPAGSRFNYVVTTISSISATLHDFVTNQLLPPTPMMVAFKGSPTSASPMVTRPTTNPTTISGVWASLPYLKPIVVSGLANNLNMSVSDISFPVLPAGSPAMTLVVCNFSISPGFNSAAITIADVDPNIGHSGLLSDLGGSRAPSPNISSIPIDSTAALFATTATKGLAIGTDEPALQVRKVGDASLATTAALTGTGGATGYSLVRSSGFGVTNGLSTLAGVTSTAVASKTAGATTATALAA